MIFNCSILKNSIRYTLFLLFLSASYPSVAHVALDYPAGGEIFSPGDVVTIQWHNVIAHEQENWDLLYTTDNGANWDILVSDLPASEFEYEWTLPEIYTEEARIKIIQDNVETDYEALSHLFSIQDPSALDGVNGNGNSPVGFCTCTTSLVDGSTLFSFNLRSKERVVVEIYDLSGRIKESLLDEILTPGVYNLQFVTGRTAANTLFIYRIRAGEFSKSGIFR